MALLDVRYQLVRGDGKMPQYDRADHIWIRRSKNTYKCILCGGITHKPPPNYPTPPTWMPLCYEPLTVDERKLVPNPNGGKL